MDKVEAIAKLKLGNKLTHEYFTSEEYIFLLGLRVFSEDGVCHGTIGEFFSHRTVLGWNTGWSIYIKQDKSHE